MRHLLHVSFDLLLDTGMNRLVKPAFLVAMIGLIILLSLRTAPRNPGDTPAAGDEDSARFDLAPALLRSGHWEAAARAYATLTTIEPAQAGLHFWAGALQAPGDPAAARDHLHRALSDPLYAAQAQPLLAALDEEGIVTDPRPFAARLGLAYLAIGEPSLAAWQLLAAVQVRPDLVDAWAYLGLAQEQSGGNGRPAIAHALELAPDNPLAHSLMGHLWLTRGRPDLARPEFLAARDLDPANPVHLADIAFTYQMEGDLYAAQAWYQAAVRQAPADPTFWILLAHFTIDTLGDPQEGLLAAQQAVALSPHDPAALDALGWAQVQTAQLRLAETNLLAAHRRAPSDPAIHYHLGKLAIHQGEWDGARAAFEQAIALATTCGACPSPTLGWYGRLAQRELDGR